MKNYSEDFVNFNMNLDCIKVTCHSRCDLRVLEEVGVTNH